MSTKKIFSSAKNFFYNKNFFGIFTLFFGIFFLFPEFSNAGYLPDGWSNEIDSQLQLTYKQGDGVDQLKDYLTGTFVPLTKFIMVGVAILFMILALFAIVLSIGSESETEAKNFGTNFGFAILGFILISFAEKIANALDPIVGNNAAEFGNISKFEGMANILVDFAAIIIGGIAVAVIVISGIKILKSQGEGIEDEFKKILSAGVGLVLTLLSRKFVYEIFFTNYGMSGVKQDGSLTFTQEVMGVVSYFMQFIVIGGIALIILAGAYYMFSSGEGNDNTGLAKGIVKNVSIGLVILMSSYSLVTIFLPI